jgi:hypothetical protein
VFSELQHNRRPDFFCSAEEGSGLSEMLSHLDDERRGDVGENLYLFGIVLMGPD